MNHPYSGVICFLFVYIGVVTGFSVGSRYYIISIILFFPAPVI